MGLAIPFPAAGLIKAKMKAIRRHSREIVDVKFFLCTLCKIYAMPLGFDVTPNLSNVSELFPRKISIFENVL